MFENQYDIKRQKQSPNLLTHYLTKVIVRKDSHNSSKFNIISKLIDVLPDDTSGRSGSGREGSVPAADEIDRRGGSGSGCGSGGGISPAPASPRAITAADAARRLRHENERLRGEAARLRRLLVAAAERGEAGAALLAQPAATTPDPPPPEGSDAARIRTLETELKMAREAVIGEWLKSRF